MFKMIVGFVGAALCAGVIAAAIVEKAEGSVPVSVERNVYECVVLSGGAWLPCVEFYGYREA